MKIKIFNYLITIERNDATWEQRLINNATILAKKEGISLNGTDRLNRKINRIRAIRLLRFPYPEDSVYSSIGYINNNGMSSLSAAKTFVEDFWLEKENK